MRELLRITVDSRIVTAQEALAKLGYGVMISGESDAGTRRALSEFARRHGLPAADSLTPEIAVALRHAGERAFIPFGLHDAWITTGSWSALRYASVHAEGTWSPADPPLQTSSIWCYRDMNACREAVAYIQAGQLYTDVVEYDIDTWNADELTAHSNSLCMSDKLIINRSQQSAVLVRSARGAGGALCDRTRSGNKESVARLINGREVALSVGVEGMRFVRYGEKASDLMRRSLQLSKAKP